VDECELPPPAPRVTMQRTAGSASHCRRSVGSWWAVLATSTECRSTKETRVQNALDYVGLVDIARHVTGCRLTQARGFKAV